MFRQRLGAGFAQYGEEVDLVTVLHCLKGVYGEDGTSPQSHTAKGQELTDTTYKKGKFNWT